MFPECHIQLGHFTGAGYAFNFQEFPPNGGCRNGGRRVNRFLVNEWLCAGGGSWIWFHKKRI
jgi:hypothetical protein